MTIIATGLSGTLGKKLDKDIQSAQVVLGSGRPLGNFQAPNSQLTLIHLGGVVGEERVSRDLIYSRHINVDETFNLARQVIERFDGRFIYISSSHVYGSQSSTLLETSPYNPHSNYASQKMRAEELLLDHFGEGHPQLTILRVFSVLGWDVADFTLGGAVKRILGGSTESILYADDVRDFMTPTTIAKNISAIAKGSKVSGIFNLCSGSGITVGEAVRSMFKVANFQESPHHLKSGKSKMPYRVGDNTKLKMTGLDLHLTWDPADDLG